MYMCVADVCKWSLTFDGERWKDLWPAALILPLSLSLTIVDLSFFSRAFARDSTPPSSSILLMTKLWAGARAKLRLSSETCKEQCVCVCVCVCECGSIFTAAGKKLVCVSWRDRQPAAHVGSGFSLSGHRATKEKALSLKSNIKCTKFAASALVHTHTHTHTQSLAKVDARTTNDELRVRRRRWQSQHLLALGDGLWPKVNVVEVVSPGWELIDYSFRLGYCAPAGESDWEQRSHGSPMELRVV